MLKLLAAASRHSLGSIQDLSGSVPLEPSHGVQHRPPPQAVEQAPPPEQAEAVKLFYDALQIQHEGLISPDDHLFLNTLMDEVMLSKHVPDASELAQLRSVVQVAVARLRGMEMSELVVSKFGGDDQAAVRDSLAALKGRVSEEAYQAALAQTLQLLDGRTPLDNALDRQALAKTALADLAAPWKISQADKGTCAATSGQIALALANPARYVRLLTALASPDGDAASLVPGLKRPPDVDLAGSVSARRSCTVRVLSPSFMNLAVGGTYSDARDLDTRRVKGGLDPDRIKVYLAAVLETTVQSHDDTTGKRQLFEDLKAALAGGPVVAGLRWDDSEATGGHAVLVTGLDDKFAYMANPWGQLDKVPLDEFKKHLGSFSVPAQVIPLPAQMKLDPPDNKTNYQELRPSKYLSTTEITRRKDVDKAIRYVQKFPGFSDLAPELQQRLTSLLRYAEVTMPYVFPTPTEKVDGLEIYAGNENKLYQLLMSGLVDDNLVSKLEAIVADADYTDINGVLGDTARDLRDALREAWEGHIASVAGFSLLPDDLQVCLQEVASLAIALRFQDLQGPLAGLIASGKLDDDTMYDIKSAIDDALVVEAKPPDIAKALLAKIKDVTDN